LECAYGRVPGRRGRACRSSRPAAAAAPARAVAKRVRGLPRVSANTHRAATCRQRLALRVRAPRSRSTGFC
jgi:hypothetical protein